MFSLGFVYGLFYGSVEFYYMLNFCLGECLCEVVIICDCFYGVFCCNLFNMLMVIGVGGFGFEIF